MSRQAKNRLTWGLIGFAALVFTMTGGFKAFGDMETIREQAWTAEFSDQSIRLIGWAELLGAIGLVLPGLTRILPWMTPVAALALAANMVGAIITHIGVEDPAGMLVMPVVLLVVTLVIAWLRLKVVPVEARNAGDIPQVEDMLDPQDDLPGSGS